MSNITCPLNFVSKQIARLSLLLPWMTLLPFVKASFGPDPFHIALSVSSVIALSMPMGEEDSQDTLILSSVLLLLLLVYLFTHLKTASVIFMNMCLCCILNLYRSIRRTCRLSALFRAAENWISLQLTFRLLLTLLLFCLMFASALSSDCMSLNILLLLPETAFSILIWRRVKAGRSLFLNREKEGEFRRLAGLALVREKRIEGQPETICSDKDAELMGRVKDIMENKKPFLDEKFSLIKLAALVYSNKTTLSRLLNNTMKTTFRKFANEYRIDYALKLMDENPHLKICEYSERSGFHNTVTFGSAFREKVGLNPGEYLLERKVQLSNARQSSSPDG